MARRRVFALAITIATLVIVRAAIITGAGDRAFSVGGDLYQRKNMTKEQWSDSRKS